MHDNHGLKDEHLICGRGNINWKKIAIGLKKIPNIVLSAEVKTTEMDSKNFIKETYECLCEIGNMVIK